MKLFAAILCVVFFTKASVGLRESTQLCPTHLIGIHLVRLRITASFVRPFCRSATAQARQAGTTACESVEAARVPFLQDSHLWDG